MPIITCFHKRLDEWIAVLPGRDDLCGFGENAHNAALELMDQIPLCQWCNSAITSEKENDAHNACAIMNSDSPMMLNPNKFIPCPRTSNEPPGHGDPCD